MTTPHDQRPFGPPDDPDRFEDFDECVTALQDDEDLTQDEAERICGAWKEDTESTTDAHMTDTDEPQYRQHYHADPADVEIREGLDPDDVRQDVDLADGAELFEIRMPIASTAEVRNEGDDPLTRDELDGMARQLTERQIGVFPAHGKDSLVADSRYSPFEKLGFWDAAEVDTRDGSDLLMASAQLPEPRELPAETGEFRQALAIWKEQARHGIAHESSIGWREEESAPGGNDLMEASIVGIGADKLTNTETAAMARAAVDAGADPEAFVETVRDVVMGADTDDDEADTHMTDADESGEEPDTDTEQQEPDELSAEEFRQEMLELQNQQMEVLETLAGDMDGDDEDDDDDEDEDDEQSADADTQASDDGDDSDRDVDAEIEALREQVNDLREGGVDADDVDTPDAETDDEQDADDADAESASSGDSYNKFGLKGV